MTRLHENLHFASGPEDILLITPKWPYYREEGGVVDLYDKLRSKQLKLHRRDLPDNFGIKPPKPETSYGYINLRGENVIAFHENQI